MKLKEARKLKVIQLVPELISGGVERGTLEVGRYLSEQGHESVVISNGGGLVGKLKKEGSRHIKLPVHKKNISSLFQVKKLRRVFESEKPDIIHLRSRVPAWLAWLAWRKMNPISRPRIVTTVHGMYSVNFYSKIMTRGESVICVSNSVKKYILNNYPNITACKPTVIYRGVDPEKYPYNFKPSGDWLTKWYFQFPETKNRKILTLPGRISSIKGHKDFLKIVKAFKDTNYHGLIAGSIHSKKNRYFNDIKKLTKDLGISNQITFTGHRRDLKEILSISSVVFSLSQKPESFGRTTLEALTLGRPVIGYDHGGVGEILNEILPKGKISFGNTNAAIKLIKKWETQPAKPNKENPFTLIRMQDQTLKLYNGLLG